MMPAVALFSKPNGEPMASTHCPGLMREGSPSFTIGRLLALILMTATSVRSSAPMTLRRELAPVGEPHGHFLGIRHHVGVGENVAVRADDEARARAAHRLRRAIRSAIGGRDAEATEESLNGSLAEPVPCTLPSRPPRRSPPPARSGRPGVRSPASAQHRLPWRGGRLRQLRRSCDRRGGIRVRRCLRRARAGGERERGHGQC